MKLSKDQFYKDPVLGEARRRSPELDFGVWWREAWAVPTYRISWVEDTGEVIAVENRNDQAGDRYEIIGKTEPKNREAIENKLKGWAEKCGGLHSLSWVRSLFEK